MRNTEPVTPPETDGDPFAGVAPNLLSRGDHVWAGRPGSEKWRTVNRVEYRPGRWTYNGLGRPQTKSAGFHVVVCDDGWEAVVVDGDDITVRIGPASSSPPAAPDETED